MGAILMSSAIIPLVAGLAFAAVVFAARPGPAVMVLAAAAAVLIVTCGLEGLPPLPPVSSKHKLPYIFAGLGLLTALAARQGRAPHPALAALFGLAALAWIGERKLLADPLQPELALVLLPVAGMAIAAKAAGSARHRPLLWPGFTILTALAGSYISVTGGYIGLAQFLGALAALVGAYALVLYVRQLTGRDTAVAGTGAVGWFLVAVLSVVLGSIAMFASRLSTPAFVILSLAYLTPPLAARSVKSASWWAPVAQGAVTLAVVLAAACVAAFSTA
ncbi:hypothetical protein [Frigidibacter sp. SD6-1]|uniref:hypothetical protein n=1 Tax=Frigidibacter sp. SD6-1 TaxID=3032581 RepID=UPI0024E020CC|nr:hypothetical protein [Frigidibacter sp. SD6-1]